MDGRDELCGQAASRDQQGLHSELCYKRLERGRFAWPRADGGVVSLTSAQLGLLLEGFDWRQPVDAARPCSAL
ncbi:IS66 family insertion sequence element accessory protein TnpB [Paraburkholderia aspalathi]|uniref:IS66 family insertion sequence element accessory protein TnpB n=1 Tax=Paraburkholderia aspalathi TaxID=1324617 RepID=UPI00190D5944|nr:transposase [Paraburkholderia aspalathi]MBK3836204.1 transposase [Paraburkholderia aspalathi]MBK3865966.1 transposase [Paraburkholderia aspalathi]